MKLFLALILSSSFVFIGFLSAERQRKCTKALGNAVDFISAVKTELRFKNADFSSICRLLDNGSFSFLSSVWFSKNRGMSATFLHAVVLQVPHPLQKRLCVGAEFRAQKAVFPAAA